MGEFIKKGNSELQNRNLFGRIKSIKEMSYEIIGKKNKMANIWEPTNSIKNLPYLERVINSQIVEEKLKKIEYVFFHKNGNLEEEKSCDSEDNLNSRITYQYDNAKNKIKETSFDSTGKIWNQIIYQYDDNGNLLKEIDAIPNSPNSIIRDYSYKFDLNGNIMEKTFSINEGKIIVESYKYEENGNIFIESIIYNEDGEIEYSSTEIINKNGKFVKDSNDSTYEYDESGNIVKVSHFFNGETEFSYCYVFDKIGNWVKRLEERYHIDFDFYHNTRIYVRIGKVTLIKREIEYYDSDKKWWNIFSK